MFGRMKDRLLLWQATRVAGRRGVTMIEYILIATLISIVAIGVMTNVGSQIGIKWTAIWTALGGTTTPGG